MADLIYRQAAIDGKFPIKLANGVEIYDSEAVLVDYLRALPSAHPEMDEWCTDCKEYDHERHCCPRFNRVIREAAEEVRQNAEPRWIPVTERLPEPPSFCLVTTDGSHNDVIDIALFMSDGWHKASAILAWMPLPGAYKGGNDGRPD